MQSSNSAARLEPTAPDALSLSTRAKLQVVKSAVPEEKGFERPKLSLSFRRFAIRDQGFRSFRVF